MQWWIAAIAAPPVSYLGHRRPKRHPARTRRRVYARAKINPVQWRFRGAAAWRLACTLRRT